MGKTAIIYGSTTGTTEDIAGRIASKLNIAQGDIYEISKVTADTVAGYDTLLLGSSTWGSGDLQDDWYDVFDSGEPDSWFSLMDSPDHYRRGAANIVMPRAGAGENVVLSYSGWGDGVYPVMLTRDADGAPLGLHIDLGVVGGFASEDEEDDEDE